jgi:hypothetical protein
MPRIEIIMGLCLMAALTTACGKMGPSQVIEGQDAEAHLLMDQFRLNQAMAKAGITMDSSSNGTPSSSAAGSGTTSTPAGADCVFTNSTGSSPMATELANLQPEIQQIEQDVANQNTTNLDGDIQAFQTSLMQDIAMLMSQFEACMPPAATPTASASNDSTVGIGSTSPTSAYRFPATSEASIR